jgi:hypothetical protein
MSAQGRSGGSRRRRASDTQAAASITTIEPAAAHVSEPEVELLDDRSASITGGRRGLRLGRSLPGAVAGTVLVVGLAFGAATGPGGALGPASDRKDATGDTAVAHSGGAAGGGGSADRSYEGGGDGSKEPSHAGDQEPDATTKPGDASGDEPVKTVKPAPDPTRKPAPERTPKPTEKPADTKPPSETIAIALAIKDDHPIIEWGSCAGLDFDYYKVVRSKDSTVTWPAGGADEVVAAVERGGQRKAWDKDAPHDRKVWYRVFCVLKAESGYKVVRSSTTKGIEVPAEQEPPDPVVLGLEADVTDEGKVVLSWTACEVDGFAFYKVVRSTWNDDPSYLPWTDGTEVIGVVSERHATEWHDWAPEAGETAWYRVQCLGYDGDHKVLLGESAVVTVTMP